MVESYARDKLRSTGYNWLNKYLTSRDIPEGEAGHLFVSTKYPPDLTLLPMENV